MKTQVVLFKYEGREVWQLRLNTPHGTYWGDVDREDLAELRRAIDKATEKKDECVQS